MPDYMTAGPIVHLRRGWAKFAFVGERAHFWIEDTETMLPTIHSGGRVRYYTSLCKKAGVTNLQIPALAAGSWPKCKRCLKASNT